MKRACLLASFVVVLLSASVVLAEGGPAWPAFRAGPSRTARVDGTGTVSSPSVAWSLDVGGSLDATQLLTADLDGDGGQEALRVTAGRVVASVPGGVPRWSSPQIGALAIFDVADLDGAGTPEIVALGGSPSAIQILAGDDGRLLWTLPTSSNVVDARPIRPTAGEAPTLVVNHRFERLEAYRFDAGFRGPAMDRIWQSVADIRWSTSLTFADTNGDGVMDVVKTFDQHVAVFDIRTGAERARSANIMPENVYFYSTVAGDVDGDGRAEILAVDQSYFYSEGSSLSVLHESGAALVEKWPSIRFVDDVTAGPGNDVFRHQVVAHGNSLADLDGASPLELVYAVWDDAASTWTTYVANAATGATIGQMPGEILEAVANFDADAPLEVVTRDVDGIDYAGQPTPFFSSLRAYDVSASGAVDRGWRREDAKAALTPSRRRTSGTEAGPISSWNDANGDGSSDLYVYTNYEDEFVNENRADNVEIIGGGDGTTLYRFPFPALAEGILLASAPGVLGAASFDALVFTTDGRLRVLGLDLTEADAQAVGNHARRPLVITPAAGGANLAFVVDSTRTLRALDGTILTPDTPIERFVVRNVDQTSARGYVQTPFVPVESASGITLVTRGRATEDFQRPSLLGIGEDGTERFRVALPPRIGWSGYGDWATVELSGDGVPDLFVTLSEPDGAQLLAIRSGADGSEIRSTRLTSLLPDGDHFQGGAPIDVDGDGVVEIVGSVHPGYIAAIDVGDPLAVRWSVYPAGADAVVNGQLMAGDFDGDAEPDLVRANAQNALGPIQRLSPTGLIEARFDVGTAGVAERDMNNPAAIRRVGATDELDVVHVGMAGAWAGRLDVLAGDTLVPRFTVYLGDGTLTTAPRADVTPLFDPAVADIDGDGDDDIVVGGFDGWLYAVDGATGGLLWAHEIGAPVEHVVLADLDRDAAIEILVSSRDGMLYAIDGPGAYDAERRTPPPDGGVVGVDGGPGVDGGARGDGGTGGGDDGGCGCRVAARGAGSRGGATPFGCALAIAGLYAVRRRSRGRGSDRRR